MNPINTYPAICEVIDEEGCDLSAAAKLFTEYCELREAGSSRVGDDGDTQRLDDHLERLISSLSSVVTSLEASALTESGNAEGLTETRGATSGTGAEAAEEASEEQDDVRGMEGEDTRTRAGNLDEDMEGLLVSPRAPTASKGTPASPIVILPSSSSDDFEMLDGNAALGRKRPANTPLTRSLAGSADLEVGKVEGDSGTSDERMGKDGALGGGKRPTRRRGPRKRNPDSDDD